MAIDWNQVIFKGLEIKGIYGREMFETWYKMVAMLQSGLDSSPIITHHFAAERIRGGVRDGALRPERQGRARLGGVALSALRPSRAARCAGARSRCCAAVDWAAMNALADRILCAVEPAAAAPRLREIPYNYTSFSDREIVIRLLGARMWQLLDELRGERRTGRSARMLFEVLGDIWVVERNPYLQDDLLDNPKRRERWSTRCGTACARSRSGGRQCASAATPMPSATRRSASCSPPPRGRRCASPASFRDDRGAAQAHACACSRAHTRKDNIAFDGFARVSHVTDATDWRVEYPFVVLYPDTEDEVPALVGAASSSDSRSSRAAAAPDTPAARFRSTPPSAVINTEKLERLSAVERMRLPGHDGARRRRSMRRGRRHQARDGSRRERGLVFAVDPTSADASCIGGNVAMNAGGKKAVLWGTALDNLVSWRMVTPEPNGSR